MTRLTVLGAVATFLDAHAADADGFRGAEVLCTADEQAIVATVRWADETAWAAFARRAEVQRAAAAVAAHAPEVLVAEPAHRTVPR